MKSAYEIMKSVTNGQDYTVKIGILTLCVLIDRSALPDKEKASMINQAKTQIENEKGKVKK